MASGANVITSWAGLGVDRLQVMNPGVFHTSHSLAQHILATSSVSFHSGLLVPFIKRQADNFSISPRFELDCLVSLNFPPFERHSPILCFALAHPTLYPTPNP